MMMMTLTLSLDKVEAVLRHLKVQPTAFVSISSGFM